jgi:pectinesterase inhibitor-like protein
MKMKPVYGKVNPIEEDEEVSSRLPSKSPTSRRSIIFFSLFLILLLAGIVAVFIHGCNTKSPTSKLGGKTNDSIRVVCSVTQYPESCFASISSSSSSASCDPEHMFTLSLRVAADELSNISSLPNRLISESNDPSTVSALRDCVSLFEDALSQLNNSVAFVTVDPPEKVLTEDKIQDLNTWISAAMTDQETCLDGLQEMGSTVLDLVKLRVQKSKEYMSNSLSILSNIHSILTKFGFTMH